MKTSKKQRIAWREEYMSCKQCPGCGGDLPIHRPIVRGDDVVVRCSWGDTMALLDDVADLEEWALRAKWYLDSNCAGQDSADRLRAAIDLIYT